MHRSKKNSSAKCNLLDVNNLIYLEAKTIKSHDKLFLFEQP